MKFTAQETQRNNSQCVILYTVYIKASKHTVLHVSSHLQQRGSNPHGRCEVGKWVGLIWRAKWKLCVCKWRILTETSEFSHNKHVQYVKLLSCVTNAAQTCHRGMTPSHILKRKYGQTCFQPFKCRKHHAHAPWLTSPQYSSNCMWFPLDWQLRSGAVSVCRQ